MEHILSECREQLLVLSIVAGVEVLGDEVGRISMDRLSVKEFFDPLLPHFVLIDGALKSKTVCVNSSLKRIP